LRGKIFAKRRHNIITRYIKAKSAALAKGVLLTPSAKALLIRHIMLFKETRKNISKFKFKPFAYFKFLCYCLSNRRILKKILHKNPNPRGYRQKNLPGLYRNFLKKYLSRLYLSYSRSLNRKRQGKLSLLKAKSRRIKRSVAHVRQKKQRKLLSLLHINVLYDKLASKKIKIRRLQRPRHRAKARRLTAKINRHKLLLGGAIKTIFPKKRKNIAFSFKVINV
jgi:hypothetical protein